MTALILEDSRADRARFRRLFEPTRRPFEFAWSWQDAGPPSVLAWFERRLGNRLGLHDDAPGVQLSSVLERYAGEARALFGGYDLLITDLAWSNAAEIAMQTVQSVSPRRASAMARGGDHLNALVRSVEGLALLEWCCDAQIGVQVWVTSAYVPAAAMGLRELLEARYAVRPEQSLFHKWMDEQCLVGDFATPLLSASPQ